MLEEIESEVCASLKLSPSEFRNVLGMIRPHLDTSVGDLLGAPELAP